MQIIVSPLAQWKIEELLYYLETEWSVQSKDKFLGILKKSFTQISTVPQSGRQSHVIPNLYKIVVTKQTSYFYQIKESRIEIVDLIDNRQDPDGIYDKMIKKFGQQDFE